jgi:hypothetical protein
MVPNLTVIMAPAATTAIPTIPKKPHTPGLAALIAPDVGSSFRQDFVVLRVAVQRICAADAN